MPAPQLTTALQFVSTWITEKPPKATATNTARWDALRQLAEEIGVEAEQLGLRFLTAPSNLKNIGNPVPGRTKSRSYWLEYLDTAHRPGWILSEKYEQWLASNSVLSFWDHIGAPPPNTAKVKYYGGTTSSVAEIGTDRRIPQNQRKGLHKALHVCHRWHIVPAFGRDHTHPAVLHRDLTCRGHRPAAQESGMMVFALNVLVDVQVLVQIHNEDAPSLAGENGGEVLGRE